MIILFILPILSTTVRINSDTNLLDSYFETCYVHLTPLDYLFALNLSLKCELNWDDNNNNNNNKGADGEYIKRRAGQFDSIQFDSIVYDCRSLYIVIIIVIIVVVVDVMLTDGMARESIK